MNLIASLLSMVIKILPSSRRWRYRLDKDLVHQTTRLNGITFHSDWLTIENGTIRLKEGYAWDGVTPAFYFLGIWWGVWDGPKGVDKKVVSWKATAIHDAFCQFVGLIKGISRDQTVEIFKELLEQNGAPKFMSTIYPWFVRYCGPQDWS